ncbi:MAG TPA: S41 family peptidase [Candidatus Binatia bacterium]|jgi:hypothetical protein|nr:S41 family peptidase [Candidatus Binatia bacterium]
MIRVRTFSLAAALLVLGAGSGGLAAEPQGQDEDFKEVFDLIRAHLAGAKDADLDRTAVQSLVAALSPRVSLLTNNIATPAPEEGPMVSRATVLENGIAYLRLTRIEDGLAAKIRQTCAQLAGTNQLGGVILDLRYATGNDYPAAAAAADLFLSKERPLLDWGNGVVRSKQKSDAIRMPVAVLVNHETAGGAEALAAVLRETAAGLLLGSQTAGQAMIAQEYPLKNGQRLRIATAPIQLGDGSALSSQGVKPDITVEVTPQDERVYYADAFKDISRSNLSTGAGLALTNQGSANSRTNRRPRLNEAELVRERRDGFLPEAEVPAGRQAELDKPLIQDPVLARALDVLKGLAVVRRQRS